MQTVLKPDHSNNMQLCRQNMPWCQGQNITGAIVLTLGNKVVLDCIVTAILKKSILSSTTPQRLASICHHLPLPLPSGSTLSAHHELAISQTYQTDFTEQTYYSLPDLLCRTHRGPDSYEVTTPWPNSLCRTHMGQTYRGPNSKCRGPKPDFAELTQAELTGPPKELQIVSSLNN